MSNVFLCEEIDYQTVERMIVVVQTTIVMLLLLMVIVMLLNTNCNNNKEKYLQPKKSFEKMAKKK